MHLLFGIDNNFLLFLSLSYSNYMKALLKFQISHFNFFPLHICYMSFWLLFFILFWLNYKITNVFSISSFFLFFNLSSLILILFIAIFFFIILKLFFSYNFILHRFFPSNLILVLFSPYLFYFGKFFKFIFSWFYPSELNWLGIKFFYWIPRSMISQVAF